MPVTPVGWGNRLMGVLGSLLGGAATGICETRVWHKGSQAEAPLW